MTKILPVIMCGGAGTRVWPESRDSLPKQFIPLVSERSTFQMLVDMLKDPLFEKPIVLTNVDYRFLVVDQLQAINAEADIVLEPMRRDSGPAVAVAAEMAARRSPDAVVVVFAADHVVQDRPKLIQHCREAAEAAAAGAIVTLGIRPTGPATGYGYIRAGEPLKEGSPVRKVEAFVEKPDLATAQKYVAQGYFWNCGYFVFRADVMQGELDKYEPAMREAAAAAVEAARPDLKFIVLDAEAFGKAPKKSIDYAVIERSDRLALVPADIGWSDVGTWEAVWELSNRDADGNSVRGHGVVLGGRNVHIRSDEHLTAVVGVEDVVVVTTQDAVLVLHRSKSDQVKALVDHLKATNRREAAEHRRIFRPWGYYQSIDNGARHQVKRIVVKPGDRLSLQKHFHRAEHWIVVKGTAEVDRDGERHLVHENESIYLPIGCVHRLGNPGKIDLELIEVQTGSYLGEDDIVRIEDVYNRE
ncbi:MAG: mannose-1-phosphate guanylyltransferase/mannose-6-phosphate isomerase [Methylobacteriaceae bacterium]|nr:mannose-1-phosphate guanylyltransferase/mannose-6-phosphate isomerase [Methylobacteriaceae bacterium]MCC0002582.1 mannose-1-phosphate guanylyltransferase/mannose-6-phosphate isomerase [Methylobacteriaceae bacterium]HPG03236.1 mannose-1-phosphate guanylyltransferase/mannose-6-phosphate isomerase [Rhodoblastus sp.]